MGSINYIQFDQKIHTYNRIYVIEICHDYVAPGFYGQARRTGANITISRLAANSSFSVDKFN